MSGNTKARTRRFSTWTTRRWLRAGVAVSLTVLTLLGVTGAWVLGRTESISDTLVNTKSPALSTSFRLESALLNQETGIRGYGLTGTSDFLTPYQQGLTDQATHTETLTRLLHGDAARLRDLTAVQDAVATWQERIAEPIASSPAGTTSPLLTERAAEGKETFDAVRIALSSQQDRLRADRARAVQDLSDTMTLRNWVFTAIALVIAALTVLVFEGLRRGITRPLEQLGADARTIAAGTFEHPITSTGPADLRRLSSEIDFMRRRLVRELAFTEEARRGRGAPAAGRRRPPPPLVQVGGGGVLKK
ncbi:CHASE3 domain-containing protein, partial [Streptomyces goshikiensis]